METPIYHINVIILWWWRSHPGLFASQILFGSHPCLLIKGIQSLPPPSNKGSIAGLIKENQWLINPYSGRLFLRGGSFGGGVARIPMSSQLRWFFIKMERLWILTTQKTWVKMGCNQLFCGDWGNHQRITPWKFSSLPLKYIPNPKRKNIIFQTITGKLQLRECTWILWLKSHSQPPEMYETLLG